MSAPMGVPKRGQIGVAATIAAAARLVLDRKGELFRVGLVLILGVFAIGIFIIRSLLPLLQTSVPQVGGPAAGQPMPDPRLLPGLLLILVAEFILIAVFAVGWHRLILLGAGASRGLGIALGRREIAYFGRMWLCFLGLLLSSVLFSYAEYALAGALHADPASFLAVAYVGYALAAAYVLGRIGPSFAALSVDESLGFVGAWAATRGEGLRILAVYALIGAGWFIFGFLVSVLAELLNLGRLAPYAMLFVNAVLSSAFMALLVTINSLLFRQLTGWRPRA